MVSQQINDDGSPARRTAANAISEDVILDAAAKLMATIGIRRTTMADVARAAGVSRATLYRRFPNVTALAAQVTTREFQRVAAAARLDFSGPDLPSRDALIDALVHLVREARRHPLLQRIIELDPEFLTPYLIQRGGRTSHGQLTDLTALITVAQGCGQIRAGTPSRMAATVLQMAWSFALTGPVFVTDDHGEPDTETLDAELTDLLERYLRP